MIFRFDMNDLNRVKNFKVGKMKKKTAAVGIDFSGTVLLCGAACN